MRTLEIEGVGNFQDKNGYWSAEPAALFGSHLEISGAIPSNQQLSQTRSICEVWHQVLQQCHEYIAANRPRYGLQARQFLNPGVIVGKDSWTVFFDTEIENESVVGVEFLGSIPSQLVIGS